MAINKTFVINKQTIDYAKNNQYKITITNLYYPNLKFSGYMTNEFKIRTDAKYAPMLNSDDLFSSTQKAASVLLNKGIANTGFWSQRYFQNGGYIILEPELRIVDFSGSLPEDDPIFATNFFTSLCLPKGGPPLIDFINSARVTSRALGNVGADVDAAINKSTGFIDSAFTAVKTVTKDVVAGASQAYDYAKSLGVSDIVSENPAPVRVQIGSFFDSSKMREGSADSGFEMGFYVQAADCTFSKEMTTRGPLYVTIKLELQTMARPASSGVGLFRLDRFTVVPASAGVQK